MGVVRGQVYVQHGSPMSFDAVAQGNDLGAAGAEALLPALEKLENLVSLDLNGTCGDV